MNALVAFEQQLEPLAPRFAEALGDIMPVQRLIRTVIISAERQPALLECDRQSLFNGAMTFAVLALEVDGATGQGYLMPFNDRRRGIKIVQPVIGYKGYNTIGARSGLTIAGAVVREGDEFDYAEGSRAFVHHKKLLGDEKDRRIIAAWSTATSNSRPATVKVLSIDDINFVKQKSPRGNEPPWADPYIGFPAMAEKTAKRRLARDMPLSVFQLAARMEEAFEEQGKPAWISPDRSLVIDGDVIAPRQSSNTPRAEDLIASPPEFGKAKALMAEQASLGTAALEAAWHTLSREIKAVLKPDMAAHKRTAAEADRKLYEPSGGASAEPPSEAVASDPPRGDQAAGGGAFIPASPASPKPRPDAAAIDAARQRGRDDRAAGVKRSATPVEWRGPDSTALALAWVEGWNEPPS